MNYNYLQDLFIDEVKGALSGGGFTPPESEALTAEHIYKTTRPKDWLPVPRPGDNEMYLLGHLFDGITNGFSAVLTFDGSCSVEFGTVEQGEFVSISSTAVTSGTRFSVALNPADYGHKTFDGFKQYMVRISGNFSKIDLTKETVNSTPSYIVEIACGAVCTIVAGASNTEERSLQSLKYVRFTGGGQCFYLRNAFANCQRLMAVSSETNAEYSRESSFGFYNCKGLMAVSTAVLGHGDMARTFYGSGIQMLRTGMSTAYCALLFAYSQLVDFTPETLNTKTATNLSEMFSNAYALRSVVGLDLSAATDVTNIFKYTSSLSRLVFAGETTPGGWTINLTQTSLGHDALVEMIASLPTATAAATITITGVPGASELTDDEIAVATAKNWTITR